jgi:hypothetical protein
MAKAKTKELLVPWRDKLVGKWEFNLYGNDIMFTYDQKRRY